MSSLPGFRTANYSSTECLRHSLDGDDGLHFHPYKNDSVHLKHPLFIPLFILVSALFCFDSLLVSDESEKEMSQSGIRGSGEFCC